MKWATTYITLTIFLAFLGYFKDPVYYYGVVIFGIVALYWIRKEWKKIIKKKLNKK